MKLTIVYDNKIFKREIGLKSDWGFSCLIESKNDTILFDTGARGEILLHNMKILDISPNTINKIVISHEHSDHKGGLKNLLYYIKDVEVYHLGNEEISKNIRPIIPKIPEKICENVWTTGRIKGLVDEQSLVLKSNRDWYVLTGCSHPGVDNILKVAKQIGNVVGIIGGFHGFNNFSIVEDLKFICPCHCTAHTDDLKKAFPEKISNCGVGKTIFLDKEL